MGDKLTKILNAPNGAITKQNSYFEILNKSHRQITEIEKNSEEWEAMLKHCGPSVYIIRCHNQYKIGTTSSSIQNRLMGLQVGNPYELEIVFCIKNKESKSMEKKLHDKFKHTSKRVRGEWFELTTEDFWEIEDIIKDYWKTNANRETKENS